MDPHEIPNDHYLVALHQLETLEQKLAAEQRFYINFNLPSDWPLSKIIEEAKGHARIVRAMGGDKTTVKQSVSSELKQP